jgi:hypothetical protein
VPSHQGAELSEVQRLQGVLESLLTLITQYPKWIKRYDWCDVSPLFWTPWLLGLVSFILSGLDCPLLATLIA